MGIGAWVGKRDCLRKKRSDEKGRYTIGIGDERGVVEDRGTRENTEENFTGLGLKNEDGSGQRGLRTRDKDRE